MDVRILRKSDLNQCGILLFAENDADGMVLRLRPDEAVEVVDVHLHLAEVLVGQLADLEIDEHIGMQEPVVEHKVYEEVFLIKGEPLLPRLKEEAFAEFKQKVLDVGDDGRFQLGLRVAGLFL